MIIVYWFFMLFRVVQVPFSLLSTIHIFYENY